MGKMRTSSVTLVLLGAAAIGHAQTAPSAPTLSTDAKPAASARATVAKTEDEFKAYRNVISQPDLVVADRLASDFASRFPESDLREPLYQTLMLRHQAANDGERALADAERVLLMNPQNTVALVAAANVISERTLPGKPDAEHRFDQGLRYAERALQALESGSAAPATATPEQAAELKNTLLAVARAAKGNIYLLQKDYPEAEKHLAEAVKVSPKPDAVSIYRLALAQHGQKRLSEALANVDRAIEAANAAHDLLLVERAKTEKAILIRSGARL